jgi:hypothetical protein
MKNNKIKITSPLLIGVYDFYIGEKNQKKNRQKHIKQKE